MTEAEQRKAYLEQLVLNALTVNSDESEGQQVINLSEINICSVDGNPTEEPYYTKDEVDTILHFNDPNVTHKAVNPNPDISTGTGTGTGDGSTGTGTANPTVNLIDNNPVIDNTALDGTDSAGITNNASGSGNDTSTGTGDEHNEYSFDMTGLTDDIDREALINAIVNDDNPSGLLHAVVEFATPSIRDTEGVDYQLYIKPGQQLTADTIIGTVKMNGVTKPIKSIFDSGTVLADESGTGFKHLYKGAGANRHFIIEDYTLCGEATDVNTDLIDSITAKFEKESQLNQLITDTMCESILPWILQRRYTSYKYVAMFRVNRPNGREIFGEYLDYVNTIKEAYSNDIQQMATVDNIKATNGSIKKMNALGDSIIARRQKYADDLIDTFKNYRDTLDKCEYDPDYSDCKYLAFEHSIDYGEQSTSGTIGGEDYNNYYMALLSQLDLATDNPYAQQYYEIISKIIEIRITMEVYKLEDIVNEFITLFRKIVNSTYNNPYEKLYNAMKELDTVEYSDIVNWITNKLNDSQSNEYTSYGIKQIANIFMFCWNYEAYSVPKVNINVTVTDYEYKTYSIDTKFYWVEGAKFPEGILVDEKTFEDVLNGTYSVGQTDGEYAVNLDGVTGWLRSKNSMQVVLYIPKLTTEQWEQLKTNASSQTLTIFDLVKEEWNKISDFWDGILTEYYNCQMTDNISEFTDVANSLEKYANWPLSSPLSIGYDTYEHYLFQNTATVTADADEDYECGIDYDTTEPEIPTEMEAPEATLDDLLENDDDVQDGEPTIKDFSYWQRYFALSTVISLPYLNCGLDILPFVQMIPLPCIFTCIGVIYIQVLDIVMVFGIAIRGMYIWPIVLFVNLSNQYANVMTVLVAQLKNIMAKINVKINSLAEAPITSLANGYINMLEEDNQNLRNQNKLLETYIAQINAQKTENDYKIKKMINKIFKPNVKQTQQVIDPLNAETTTTN